MAVKSLVIDDGSLEYEIRNKHGATIGSFRINPADPELVTRAEETIKRFNTLSYQDDSEENDTMETLKQLSSEVHDIFDVLFGYPVSADLFSGCGALTVVADGDFYFEKVLEHILGIVQEVTEKRIDKKLEKVRKATAKYHK